MFWTGKLAAHGLGRSRGRIALLLVGLAVVAIAMIGGPFSATAQQAKTLTAGQPIQTKSRNAILMEAETGAVLFSHNADDMIPPASMSKLMTLAVLFNALKEGQVKLDTDFPVSEHAWRTGGGPSGTSAMMVPLNSRERIDQLLQGVVVQSGNDAAIAIAEGLSGSEADFAVRMTEYARKIGLKKSTFRNATGLPHPDQLMTAREIGQLARYIITEHADYYPYFGQKEFQYRNHKFPNRNRLLFLPGGVDGLKTGATKEAGYGVVASAKQDDRRLIVVVSGLASDKERTEEASRLLDWGFKSFNSFKLFDPGEVVGKARVYGGSAFYVPLVGNGEVHIWLPRFAASQKLNAQIIHQSPLKAPIKKGDPIATLRVTTAGGASNEAQLYAAEDVESGGFSRRGLDSLLHLAFRWAKF